MKSDEKQGWNVFKQIFEDHWESFKKKYSRYDTLYYDSLIRKMLDCGNPDKMGYTEYLCQSCWEGKRVVSNSCKSSMCLRCGKVYVDNWVSQVSRMLHPGVIYRHIVLTVPDIFRQTFYKDSGKLLSSIMRCGVNCLDDFFSVVSGKKLKGGYIAVVQTHGRNGQYNPHLHIIATSGGFDIEKQEWCHLDYLPYKMLHKKWQWYLLEMLREQVGGREIEELVDYCYRKYRRGFVANVQKGDVPAKSKSLAIYLAKYVVCPPISVRRIDKYTGDSVTYHYRSHKTDKVETDTIDVYTFIGRMVQHVLPKGFKRIRYYGVQATKTFEKLKVLIQEALSKISKIAKEAIKIIFRKSYRERYREVSGKDPLCCPHCGKKMDVWLIWHPKYGVVYDELEEIKKGKYDEKEKRSQFNPYDGRCAIRSPSTGIQLSLF